MWDVVNTALGLDVEASRLNARQVCLRGVIVFFYALFIVRIAAKRFMAQMTALDAILGFMLASTLSRAINADAPFFPTLIVVGLLVLLHRILSKLAMDFKWIGNLVKGREDILVRDGQLNEASMRKHSISESDLLEQLRLHGCVCSPSEVKQATLERSGHISVIKSKD